MTLKITNVQVWTRTNIKNRCITGITLQKTRKTEATKQMV